MKQTIKELSPHDLVPYANNSRIHSPEQVDQIAASIGEFGFVNPVLIDAKRMIIAGHGRVMAAKKLGLEKIPCLCVTGMTETQIRAYVIADNQLAINAGWDMELLKLELDDLSDDIDLHILGFDDTFLDSGLDLMGGEDDKPERENGENVGHILCPKCGCSIEVEK